MTTQGSYGPSPWDWVAEQVEKYEASGGAEAGDLRGVPVVVLTTKGRKTGLVRKSPVMRVEHDGTYGAVASMGGAPTNPVWYLNLLADADLTVQDGATVFEMRAREVTGAEKQTWWERATEVWPDYDLYQSLTDRVIPVMVLEPRPSAKG